MCFPACYSSFVSPQVQSSVSIVSFESSFFYNSKYPVLPKYREKLNGENSFFTTIAYVITHIYNCTLEPQFKKTD